jgi:hypothetical protein
MAEISGPFGSGSDTNSLDATIGFDTNSLFGTFSSDGAGNVTGSLPAVVTYGVSFCYLSDSACSFVAAYAVSPNGRGTINATITPDGSSRSFVFYMVSPNAFVISGPGPGRGSAFSNLSFFGP